MSRTKDPKPMEDSEKRRFQALQVLASWYQKCEKPHDIEKCEFHMLELLDPRHTSGKGSSMYLRSLVGYIEDSLGTDRDDYRALKKAQDILDGNDVDTSLEPK